MTTSASREKNKIILILHHLPQKSIFDYTDPDEYHEKINPMEYIKINHFPHWIGFYRRDHHVIHAQDVANLTKAYEIECWRPYGNLIKKKYEKKVDGILHKVFPSKIFTPNNWIFGTWFWSYPMYRELLKEMNDNNILVHFFDGHSRFASWIIQKLSKLKIPIVITHGSNTTKLQQFKSLRLIKKIPHFFHLYDIYIQRKKFKHIDHYFSGSIKEKEFFNTYFNWFKSIQYLPWGADFKFHQPSKNKDEIKKELNLPLDKKIILFIGRFNDDTALPDLFKVYQKLKNINISLVCIGGDKSNIYYELGKKSGAIMIERCPKEILLKYYQIADLNVYPMLNKKIVYASGFGVANAEALACGVPLLSYNIIHFPGNVDERNEIGMSMTNIEEMEKNITYMLNNPGIFNNCREISNKYLNKIIITNLYLKKYEELLNKYN